HEDDHPDTHFVCQLHDGGQLMIIRQTDDGVDLDFWTLLSHSALDFQESPGIGNDLIEIGAHADLLVRLLRCTVERKKNMIYFQLYDTSCNPFRHEGEIIVQRNIKTT